MIPITLVIIVFTVAVSLIALNQHKLMYDWILNPWQVVHERQWYRMLSSGFLHADFIHLAINMLVLYMFGEIMEDYFNIVHGNKGNLFFLMLYLSGIIMANVSSVVKYRNVGAYNALGASGATSALVFAFIVLDPWGKTVGFFFIPPGILPNIGFGALYLIYCVYMSKRGQDNIGHEAHFYGALWGALFMFVTQPYLLLRFFDKLL